MAQVFTDSGSNLLYLRDDGLLFVQLRPRKRAALCTLNVGARCNFAQTNTVVSGDVYRVTSTGVILVNWRIEQCR